MMRVQSGSNFIVEDGWTKLVRDAR
jgi:hypothetical protein